MSLPAGIATADISCVTCHDDEAKLFSNSAHQNAGLLCMDCHGGDPKIDDTAAHTPGNFFRPKDKRSIAEFCAKCHSDVRRMNPYGLPTDQFERYKTSKHGEALFGASNDNHVAVCTDCHGVHDIYKARSPQARTYPANIPATCGRCHSDPKVMGPYKLPTDIVDKYKTSYHAHMVLQKGDLSAPTCVTCHGNHGAVPPGTAQVGQVCGKCHGRQAELFAKSPHAAAAKAGKFSECVSCHGNHAIQKAAVELFSTTCLQCHAKDPKPLAVRDAVVKTLEKAKGDYHRAEARLHDASLRGLATDDEQLLLQEAKTEITQMEALQHLLAPAELHAAAARNDEAIGEILAGVDHLERVEQWKRRALIPIWAFLIFMAICFAAKRREIHQEKPDAKP